MDSGLRTADYGLRTGYEIHVRTRYKRRTGKYGLGINMDYGLLKVVNTPINSWWRCAAQFSES